MNINNKTLLITGANRGLGAALLESALKKGAQRIYAGMRSIQGYQPQDTRVQPLQIDVTDQESIQAAVGQVEALDLLINNAGLLQSYSFLDSSEEDLRADLEVNYLGGLRMSREFLGQLSNSRGAMMNILSLVSLSSMAAIGGYSASKAAAWSMTQALRAELSRRGVKVFAAYPGAIDTRMIASFEIEKTAASAVADNILEAIENDTLDCFPDPMSSQAGEAWQKAPRSLESMFANS